MTWGGKESDFEDGEWPFAGIGDAKDVPSPVGDGCIQISQVLARADEKAGEYSFGGAATTLPPIPGIFVDGVGPIALPMDQAIAEKLIARCEKSPFGHNFDTKLDENVRKSWQLQQNLIIGECDIYSTIIAFKVNNPASKVNKGEKVTKEAQISRRWLALGGDGDAEYVPVPSGVAATQISKVLARADEQAGEYSFGGQADALPAAPGLVVDGVGSIPVPITKYHAQELISKCEKSPFGHNMDTKMDDNIRKSWQLGPDHVQFENMAWQRGLDKLVEIVADRLGYNGIPLQCFLYKLLVYGEGDHFVKHQDTEKEDGMIATLVVQLPSSHEGGDLVIYRGGEVKHRHDFGKADNSAAFLPHYAVHYADAEHALEKVTKGYRLALVYSICLPSNKLHVEKRHDQPLSDDLAEAIRSMGPEDDSFALMLPHEYTKNSIQTMGVGALKGTDAARFHALAEANSFVTTDKKLKFYVARLTHKIDFEEDRNENWSPENRKQSVLWYTSSGEMLGTVKMVTAIVNFLNPGQETLYKLWVPHGVSKEEGYMGNEGPTKSTKYARYAIFAWSASRHAEFALQLMPMDIVMEALYDRKPVDAATLRKFLEVVSSRLVAEKQFGWRDDLSMKFCRLFCDLATDAGDPALIKLFFTEFCPPLGLFEANATFVPAMIKLVRGFDWNDIGKPLLEKLNSTFNTNDTEEEKFGLSRCDLGLQVLGGVDECCAQDELLNMVTQQVGRLSAKDFRSSDGSLVAWVIRSVDKSNRDIDKVVKILTDVNPGLLGPLIEKLLQHESSCGISVKDSDVFASLISKRIAWLDKQIGFLDTPFSWEMPLAQFSYDARVQEFLRGPDAAKDIKFRNANDAKGCAAVWMRKKRLNASFKIEAPSTDVVTITKTRVWFEKCQLKLQQHKEELERLDKHRSEGVDTGAQ